MASDDTINRFLTAADVLHSRRMAEAESRLSDDVWAAAISRRARRVLIISAAFAVIGVTGTGVMLAENMHINAVHHQETDQLDRQTHAILHELQTQNTLTSQQTAKILAAIRDTQLTNTQRIAAITSVVDPGALTSPEPSPSPAYSRDSRYSRTTAPTWGRWPWPSRTP